METSQRIEALIQQMTPEEKAAQLTQLGGPYFTQDAQSDVTGPLQELGLTEEAVRSAGSVLSVFSADSIIAIQNQYLEASRLKVPLLFMADVIHGYRTIFPIPLAQACTWNPDIVREGAEISAKEAAAGGQHVTFSPMADIVRDHRWGRVMESSGEDPLLSAMMSSAAVKGYQGEDCAQPGRLAACAKHFIGYGFSEGGRDYNTVDLSEAFLREYCLEPFRAVVDSGCEMVMTAFNTIERIPVAANARIMDRLLRKGLGFSGTVISDWGAVDELIVHSVAEDGKDAARLALNATVDIEMMSPHYIHHLPQLMQEGLVSTAQVDEALRRVLTLKEKLGLFENPYKDADPVKAEELYLCPEHRKAARIAAQKAPVLLKNERNVLPLSGSPLLLTGPFAQSQEVLGGWSACGRNEEAVSLFQGLQNALGTQAVEAAPWDPANTSVSIAQAVEAARDAAVILCAIGEPQEETGECTSKVDLALASDQLALLQAMHNTGKPVVAVVFSGRALELEPVCRHCDAVLQAWFLGSESGNALADLLLGTAAPTGRLAVSFPRRTGQMPLYYNGYRTGRPKPSDTADTPYVSKYIDCQNAPLFPFGYGLTYTTFSYSSLHLSARQMHPDEEITATVTVRNTGTRTGEEVVQLYLCDCCASVVRPVKELKAFRRITLSPGEETAVTFAITEAMLRFWDADGNWVSEPGRFDVFAGPNCQECSCASFILKV